MSSTTPPRSLDHYARLVRRLLRVPVGLVTLVTDHEQVFVGRDGTSDQRTPLTHSFCHLVVSEGHPLVVSDARRDERLATHPAVLERGVVAYAGWPLYDAGGTPVGTLCVVEHGPREWSTDEVTMLQELARACSVDLQRDSTLVALLDQLADLERELASSDRATASRVATIRQSVLTTP